MNDVRIKAFGLEFIIAVDITPNDFLIRRNGFTSFFYMEEFSDNQPPSPDEPFHIYDEWFSFRKEYKEAIRLFKKYKNLI